MYCVVLISPRAGTKTIEIIKYFIIIIYAFGTAHGKHGSINQHVLQPCSTPEPGELINLAVLNIKCSA